MPTPKNTKSKRRRLTPTQRERIAALVEREGQAAAAEALCISVQTLGALAAGFKVNNSIAELVERRLAELHCDDASGMEVGT